MEEQATITSVTQESPGTVSKSEAALKQTTTIVYALQAASFLIGFTFIAAVVMNYIKKAEVEGTWLESHFRWQIRTFWFGLMWIVLGSILLIFVIGLPLMIGASIWIIYRIIKGWMRLADGKPMYA